MQTQVYFNLHKKSWSMRERGRVINKGVRDTFVVLADVTFQVNEKARQRVIREKAKNVHAFAVGTVKGWQSDDWPSVLAAVKRAKVPVSYNPYKAGHFVRTDTGEAIHACKLLVMGTDLIERDGKLVRVPKVRAVL